MTAAPLETSARRPAIVRTIAWVLGIGERPGRLDLAATLQEKEAGLHWHLMLCSVSLLLVALGIAGARNDAGWASLAYWCGVAALISLAAFRIAWPLASRRERLFVVTLLGMALYAIKVLHSPVGFTHFDEFLHWVTAEDIMSGHHLFTLNSLLPVSPLYPGLEIVTTAFANLSGLSVFAAAVIVIAFARLVLIAALFLLIEALTKSSRAAALGMLIYMGGSSFALFHAQFAYESLAFTLLALTLLACMGTTEKSAGNGARRWIIALPLIAALALTHHLTAYFAVLMLSGLAVLEFVSAQQRAHALQTAALAGFAALVSIGWTKLIGNPVSGYLGPVLQSGFDELYRFLTFASFGRELFVSEDGSGLPVWQRLVAVAGLGLLCLMLATGFFRALGQAGGTSRREGRSGPLAFLYTSDSRLLLFAFLTLGFPLSLLLRFTESGWEVGNRLGSFVYLGIGVVAAIAIARFWQSDSLNPWRARAVGGALTLIVLGGFVVQWGQFALPRHYKVAADNLSIEPMGIETAKWTREWLGTGNVFAADRINRLLLATYGGQRLITTLMDDIDTSSLLFAPTLGGPELHAIRNGGVRYVLADLRMTSGLPVEGVYFETGEDSQINAVPPEASALLKFDDIGAVSRLYDNGTIIIYDVSAIDDE